MTRNREVVSAQSNGIPQKRKREIIKEINGEKEEGRGIEEEREQRRRN
jgi:hypothetical protein